MVPSCRRARMECGVRMGWAFGGAMDIILSRFEIWCCFCLGWG
jgi:hypothetical protein